MKRILSFLLLAALPLLLSGQFGEWTLHENPVLSGGPEGSWDEGVFSSSILEINDTLHLWYAGMLGDHLQIGHATSLDGLSWARDIRNPVVPNGEVGSKDYLWAYFPRVVYDGSQFHMSYYAIPASGSGETLEYAVSEDGWHWEKLDEPQAYALEDGSQFQGGGCVVYDGETFHKWYNQPAGHGFDIYHATSTDGTSWELDFDNPALVHQPQTWEKSRVQVGCVLPIEGTYHMWYCGGDFKDWMIGHATSEDGVNWMRDPANPIITKGSSGAWNEEFVGFPTVMIDEETGVLHMWYSGGGTEDSEVVPSGLGYASLAVGLPDPPETAFGLSLFPNPVRDMLHIRFESDRTGGMDPFTLEVFSVTGQTVHTEVISGTEAELQTADWDPGIYLLRMTSGSATLSRKFIRE